MASNNNFYNKFNNIPKYYIKIQVRFYKIFILLISYFLKVYLFKSFEKYNNYKYIYISKNIIRIKRLL